MAKLGVPEAASITESAQKNKELEVKLKENVAYWADPKFESMSGTLETIIKECV